MKLSCNNSPWVRGFTLAEMLIALAIFSVVALSLSSMLNVGVRTWKSGNERMKEDSRNRALFYRISKDLKNSVPYEEDLSFEGTSRKVSFMLLENKKSDLGSLRQLARVTYEYDASKKVIYRKVATAKEGFVEKKSVSQELVKDSEELEFKYAFKPVYDADLIQWKDKWEIKKSIPRAIRIRFGDFTTQVFLPLGEMGENDA